jgi:hypothetical protein
MKLLFSGSSGCRLETFKRLLLIAEELCFLDRPSISFGDWGTVGIASPLRKLIPAFRNTAVKLSVFTPYSGPANDLYKQYIDADLNNIGFQQVFLKGLAENRIFTEKFIQLNGNYVSGTGEQIRQALVHDLNLRNMSLLNTQQKSMLFEINDEDGRLCTLHSLITEASINVTNALIFADEIDSIPVTDDPFFARLISMRVTDKFYVGGTSAITPLLGFEITKTVISDDVLTKLDIPTILEYREKTKDVYRAWTAELNQLSVEIDQLPYDKIQKEVPRIIATKVVPRLVEYRNEMKSVSDKLFGDLIKTTTSNYKFAILSLAYLANHNYSQALIVFVGLVAPTVIPLTDFVQAKRNTRRRYAITYLIDLVN